MSWRLGWLERWDEISDPAFVARWREVAEGAAGHPGFQRPEVVLPWGGGCAEPAGTTPLFGLAEHPSGARAILPWVRVSRAGKLARRRLAEPALGDLAGYTDPLVSGPVADLTPLWRLARAALAERVEQGLFRFVERSLGPADAPPSRDASPVLDLSAGATLAELLARTSANHRGDLGRRFRRLAEHGPVECQVIREPAQAVAEFDGAFLAAYAAQWRASAHGSLLDRPGVANFLRRFVRSEVAGGTAHFAVLRVADRAIAWHLGIVAGGELYWWFPTYDPAWAALSPGKVLLARLLEHGLAAGWRRVHFLTGGHDYKLAWRPRPADLVTVRWFSPSLAGRAFGAYDRLRGGG